MGSSTTAAQREQACLRIRAKAEQMGMPQMDLDPGAVELVAEQAAEIERLRDLLEGCRENDRSEYYDHHEARPDGKMPREVGATCWLTPREIARRGLAWSQRIASVKEKP